VERACETADYAIRVAHAGDVDAIGQIEREAALRFLAIGMPSVAEAPCMTAATVLSLIAHGALFVATHGDRPVAFVACCELDGLGHVAELDVSLAHAGHRLGARLVERSLTWARDRGCPRMTLVTFRDVPWNAPYYRRLGFTDWGDAKLGREHRAVWRAQAAMGLDMSARLVMVRELA